MPWISAWKLFALGSAFFAALTAILGKLGVEGVPSNLATLIRTVVILVLAAAIVAFRGEWQMAGVSGWRPWVFLVTSGLATGLSWLCYYRALQLAPASKVAPVDKLSVALTILLAFVFLGEKATAKAALGGLLIVAGAILVAL